MSPWQRRGVSGAPGGWSGEARGLPALHREREGPLNRTGQVRGAHWFAWSDRQGRWLGAEVKIDPHGSFGRVYLRGSTETVLFRAQTFPCLCRVPAQQQALRGVFSPSALSLWNQGTRAGPARRQGRSPACPNRCALSPSSRPPRTTRTGPFLTRYLRAGPTQPSHQVRTPPPSPWVPCALAD